MRAVYRALDSFSEGVGRAVSWLTLAMVLVQFVVVIQRYVFSIGNLYMQESIVYMHGAIIMFASGYTLLHDGHVRVDILYRSASERRKDWTDLIGTLFFLLPMCGVIWWSALPNVELAWRMFEGSTEASGIPYKYVLKTTVMLFALLLGLQGVSNALKAALRLAGHTIDNPGRDEGRPV